MTDDERTAADDELARRRQERQDGDEGGKSIEALADADPQELFPLGTLEGDPKKTLKNLLKPGLPVEVTASLMSAEVPVASGLLDPDSPGRVMVAYEVHKAGEVIVQRKDGKVVGYKIRQVLRPTFVEAITDVAPSAATA